LTKVKSMFYSEKIERYFMSAEDKALLDGHILLVDKPLDSQFDALSNEEPSGKALRLEFTARTADYFRLWVVCQFLTLVSLGLFGPWSRTRKAKFLAEHWLLDGEPFVVNFSPIALLKGRLLVFILIFSAALLGWWNPWLRPVLIFVSFLAAPWLLANSLAFRWRTLSHRAIAFGSENNSQPLRRSMVILGVFLSMATLPNSLWQKYLPHLGFTPLAIFLLTVPALYFWPRVTSALTHYRFSQASWGAQRFDLQTTAKKIFAQMWRRAFSGWLVVMGTLGGVIAVFSLWSENRDLQAVLNSINYLLITIFAVTFARSRRLNFVLHRLHIGGLSFSSKMHPAQMSALTAGYALLAVCTLGLSVPWSTVHFCRWRAARVTPYLDGEWSQFLPAVGHQRASGVLDELGNSFDIEIGI
jgi:uncharacterized membrane protein YjgN (DUF898 family)